MLLPPADRRAGARRSPRSSAFDRDPYLVITADGRLVWLAGRLHDDRPLSRTPSRSPGVGNYIRNSVKVTVDAYDGTVSFYVADPTTR